MILDTWDVPLSYDLEISSVIMHVWLITLLN